MIFIKRLEVRNFKSFKKIDMELGDLNIIIGANAAGKSNFVSIFRFIKDIRTSGLDNAISLQGGVEYLRNMNIKASENLSIKIAYSSKYNIPNNSIYKIKNDDKFKFIIHEIAYEFALKFNKKGTGFSIAKDMLEYTITYQTLEEKEKLGKVFMLNENGKLKIKYKNIPEDIKRPITRYLIPSFANRIKLEKHDLLMSKDYLLAYPFLFNRNVFDVSDIGIYDFDPKLPKKATPIAGKAELEEDGRNLSIILKNIVENKTKRKNLFAIVGDMLPFVKDVNIERLADKSILFSLKESYFSKQYIPASLISDGTIDVTSLVVALFFERKSFLIFEEPGRNIHPSLISKLVGLFRETSSRTKKNPKQIIVTTHNPEFVKYSNIEELLFVSRDENGFSTINRLKDREDIAAFLKNETGIDELYVQNLF